MNVLVGVATIVAVAANVLFVWPQAVRLVRNKGNIAGVSPLTWTISLVLFSAFGLYSFRIDFWSLFAANVSSFIAASIIMFVGVKYGRWNVGWVAAAAAGMGMLVLSVVFVPPLVGVVMVSAGVALRVPQIVWLLKSDDVSGVSPVTWLLSGVTAGSWLVVSLSESAFAVIVANGTALSITLILLAILAFKKRKQLKTVRDVNVEGSETK